MIATTKPLTKTYTNPAAQSFHCARPSSAKDILRFHKTLPAYAPTPLHALPPSAELNGIRVFIKDESHRFGLPSFKILGASWAIHRTLCAALALDPSTATTATVGPVAQAAGLQLVSCTDGNWGRALAHTARLLGIHATVYVPRNIDEATRGRIAGEGAEVRVVQGDYDASIAAAREHAYSTGALLVMDTSWGGYEEIPGWVTEGYESMLAEVDEQLKERGCDVQPDLVIASVGVGSWAHSVVSHYKSLGRQGDTTTSIRRPGRTVVITVEPDSASSLLTSLHNNSITTVATEDTIMCGMNCGTISTIAWPLLRGGVDIALAVSDWEAHEAVRELRQKYNIEAGPCGAAPLAALKKLLRKPMSGDTPLIQDVTNVVLFCTEGARGYNIPDNDAS